MGAADLIKQIKPKTEHFVYAEKFKGKFLTIKCKNEPSPLTIRVLRNDRYNINLVSDLCSIDLTMYWSFNEKFPNKEQNDGSCNTSSMNVVFKSFDEEKFTHKKINLGFYSMSGINIVLGFSFGVDFFDDN